MRSGRRRKTEITNGVLELRVNYETAITSISSARATAASRRPRPRVAVPLLSSPLKPSSKPNRVSPLRFASSRARAPLPCSGALPPPPLAPPSLELAAKPLPCPSSATTQRPDSISLVPCISQACPPPLPGRAEAPPHHGRRLHLGRRRASSCAPPLPKPTL